MHAPPQSIIRLSGLVLALLGVRLERACAQDPSWKTYTDTMHGYAFNYPARYRMQEQFHALFLTDGRVRTQVYVEDWTRAMARGGSNWDLASLAAERAETSCLADGPDCSTSCKARSVEAIATRMACGLWWCPARASIPANQALLARSTPCTSLIFQAAGPTT